MKYNVPTSRHKASPTAAVAPALDKASDAKGDSVLRHGNGPDRTAGGGAPRRRHAAPAALGRDKNEPATKRQQMQASSAHVGTTANAEYERCKRRTKTARHEYRAILTPRALRRVIHFGRT
ncbi:hypothetical protein EVAR_61772_1 [Eumeta japonica]|uniref:Uncharacterized protein n=1 Tax=Eumeta variegata TaxID=151549 RepID=A0A4C1Z2W7_EUMVA|nr:hypothetical protein EVAR_61772_1 [Eumeta japonica]